MPGADFIDGTVCWVNATSTEGEGGFSADTVTRSFRPARQSSEKGHKHLSLMKPPWRGDEGVVRELYIFDRLLAGTYCLAANPFVRIFCVCVCAQ